LVEPDGSFTLTTYVANDGAPVGDYAVAVTLRTPPWDELGKPGPNQLPARYGQPQTSGLRAKVIEGTKELTLERKKRQVLAACRSALALPPDRQAASGHERPRIVSAKAFAAPIAAPVTAPNPAPQIAVM